MEALEQERQRAEQRLEQERQQAEWALENTLVKHVHFCQRLLRQEPTPSHQLMAQTIDELRSLAEQLERQSPAR